MKNVTIMMASLAGAAVIAAASPAVAHGYGDIPATVGVVNDTPLAAPSRPAMSAFAVQPGTQISGSNYFYAPGAGPRCEIRMKRVQGRLFQACE